MADEVEEQPELNQTVSFSSTVCMRGDNFPFMKRVVDFGSIVTFASNHGIYAIPMKN
ncbi:hypothetical protein TIFTF001_026092 [Ficus carica]|uniref:Uncharacterized protein n=1 Tax=Ficus carica TaxID=3494 RepID=A0AA88DET8_FICCA|nr:hypothetical protein TIFTF001_026092 [Ficus carica]